MRGGFLHWEPLWFTTSFLWWQSYQNMCQVAEQEWWCPIQVQKLHSLNFFYTEKKPCILALLSALAVLKPYMCVSFSSCAAASVNELLIVILGSQRMVILDNAESILLLPLTSQRGGHCLLHTEITFPYQLPVEMKCLMFACCGKVAAVNQECSESCSNLFFISRSFE